MYQNRTGKLSTIDLWYDYPNGRNLNLIQKQLGVLTHDVEYTNGTSFYYELEQGTCKKITFTVGILRPDWLSGATYIGTENIDGFKCNVWEKVDFIRYWEDVESQRPVSWLFLSSRKPCSPLLLFNSSCCGRVWMKICGPCSILPFSFLVILSSFLSLASYLMHSLGLPLSSYALCSLTRL